MKKQLESFDEENKLANARIFDENDDLKLKNTALNQEIASTRSKLY